MAGHQVELPQRGLEFTQQALQGPAHAPVPGQVQGLQERRPAESVAWATNGKVNCFTQQHKRFVLKRFLYHDDNILEDLLKLLLCLYFEI